MAGNITPEAIGAIAVLLQTAISKAATTGGANERRNTRNARVIVGSSARGTGRRAWRADKLLIHRFRKCALRA